MTDYSQAACLDLHPDEFEGAGTSWAWNACRQCPIRPGCLYDAIQERTTGVYRGGQAFGEVGGRLAKRSAYTPRGKPTTCSKCGNRRLLVMGLCKACRRGDYDTLIKQVQQATFRTRAIAALEGRQLPALCGTDSGYYRHRRAMKEEACDLCKYAHALAVRRQQAVDDDSDKQGDSGRMKRAGTVRKHPSGSDPQSFSDNERGFA